MTKHGRATTAWIALTLFTLCAAVTASAQKAEPLPIVFKPNRTSATVKGFVQGAEEAEYSFAATRGQNLTVHITANPKDSLVVQIKDPDWQGLPLKSGGNSKWTARLPKSGEYYMVVLRNRKGPGKTTYALTLSLR